jgi:amino acid adenylation domain-containing protein
MASEAIGFRPDSPRSAAPRPQFAVELISIAASDIAAATSFASDHDSTVARVWVAAFALLLHRLTNQVAGHFAYYPDGNHGVLISIDATQSSNFLAWLQVIGNALDSPAPLPSDASLPPLGFAFGKLERNFELLASVDDEQIRLRYRSDLYRATRARELLDQLVLLFRQVVRQPHRHVHEFSLVTSAAELVLPNPRLPMTTPSRPTIAALIDEAARHSPNSPAIEQGDRSWSYHQLTQVAESVALALRAGALSSGECVAVTGQRSFGFVAAMLGVFRAGGVLLNLDPSLPAQRQLLMVEQAQARHRIAVGGGDTSGALAAAPFTCSLAISTQGELLSQLPGKSPTAVLPEVRPEDPAYIFFTSGSTGTPKAVKGRHAGLSHFLNWQRTEFGIDSRDRGSQLTALSFDVILRDSFLVLVAGGTLCIPGDLDVLDPHRILAWLRAKRITVLHVVPSLARLWLRSCPNAVEPLPVEHLFFAGEPLTSVLVTDWRKAFSPGAEIVNLYGPTETTLAKCFFRVPAAPEPGVQSIGGPIADAQVLILNAQRTLCGLNEPGEIAVRTPFRTLGYLNNSEANAQSFLPNPFRDDPTDLIYLTGDGGSYRNDGSLAIYGRLDSQVKIRGIRVEPGEVEATMARHPLVRDVVVLPRVDPNGDKALVAYVVLTDPANEFEVRDRTRVLREYLRERMPAAMVPSAFVAVEALPLNANGKVDRRALPEPGRRAFATADYAVPTNELETELVSVWTQVLRQDTVGIDDDFFDLGGHSLLAVQLTQQVKWTLGHRMTIPMLFRCRTVRRLAHEIALNDSSLSETTVLPLQPRGTGPGLFCICGLHLYQELADQLAPEIPVFGVFLPFEEQLLAGATSDQPRHRSIEELASAYVAAIRQQQPQGPYLLCGVSFGGVIAYEIGYRLRCAGEMVGFVGLLDAVLPSARKRDWMRWGMYQARLLFRRGGFRGLWRRSKARLARQLGGFTRESGSAATPATGLEMVERRRRDYYRSAELSYRPPKSDNPVLLVRALKRSFADFDLRDATYGWGAAASTLEVIDVPGDHLGILEGAEVQILARRLRPYIERGRLGGIDSTATPQSR